MLKRIYILITAVLLIAVMTIGLAAYQIFSSYNDRVNRNYLISAAGMIQLDMKDGLTADQASARTLQVTSQTGVHIRVTVVDRQGSVLFDNEAVSGSMDNHLFRPEINYAFTNRSIGSATRLSSTLNMQMFYIALYDQQHDLVIRTGIPLSAYRATLNQILQTMLLVMGIALVFLILIGAFSTRLITRPLVSLQKAALAMSEGKYSTRVHLVAKKGSEIAALANVFNTMAEKLQTNVRDLEDKNLRMDVILNSMTEPLLVVDQTTAVTFLNKPAKDTFGRDLDPSHTVFPLLLLTHSNKIDQLVGQALESGKRVEIFEPVKTVRGEANFFIVASPIRSTQSAGVILTFHDVSESQRLQKMRSEFVANVTHELHTPLTSIRGFIETLRKGAISDPAVAGRFLEIIDIEAERLHKLISDILILSEIEDMKEDKEKVSFDLKAMVDSVLVMLDEAASARKVSLIAEDAETPLNVLANPYRIKQILINLVDNAIKYNYEGGKVYIKSERLSDNKVRLAVRDTGPGIPPEHLEKVFERFYRVDTSRSRELGGTGLGLSIVKHIAQLYDGIAKVHSEPGTGSEFTVEMKI